MVWVCSVSHLLNLGIVSEMAKITRQNIGLAFYHHYIQAVQQLIEKLYNCCDIITFLNLRGQFARLSLAFTSNYGRYVGRNLRMFH